MTFKDLARIIGLQNSQIQSFNLKLERLKGLPFWIWKDNEIKHRKKYVLTNGNCCFNHVIGLPKNNKTGQENPLFDYQQLIYNSLKHHKHLWILKSTGLGITEFFLRYMAWLCLKDNQYQNSQFIIVTGPNIDLAIKLIRRMKNLFIDKLDIVFDSKETVIELNKCRIEAYPSNHIDSFRSLDNPKFILLDECDFFRKGEQENVRAVAERYIAKSNPYIVMVSTPNMPGGLMESIEHEPEINCLYKRIKLDYRYGLNKIYSIEEIEKAKQSPSFEREYDLKYLGKIGNLYSQLSIEQAVERGRNNYDPENVNLFSIKFMTIDEGYSSSKFAIMVAEFLRTGKKEIRILHAEELDKPLYEEALDHIFQLRKKYGNVLNIGVDGSRPELVTSLKKKLGERYEWSYIQERLQYYKKHNIDPAEKMIIVPIVFNTESRSFMTSHSRRILDDPRGLIAIHPKFTKLITALKGAQFDDIGKLDKDESPHNDILDCFLEMSNFFKFKSKGDY